MARKKSIRVERVGAKNPPRLKQCFEAGFQPLVSTATPGGKSLTPNRIAAFIDRLDKKLVTL